MVSYSVNYNHTVILHGYGDMELQIFGGHDLDLLGSRDVIGHVTIYWSLDSQHMVSYN